MGDLREDFLPGIQRKNEEAKQEEAKRLRVLQIRRIREQKKKEKRAKIIKNIIKVIAAYLVLVNLLGASHAYNELATEKGAEKYFHKDVGINYVFDKGEEPTIGEVLERMGENPENIFVPTWIADAAEEENEIRKN